MPAVGQRGAGTGVLSARFGPTHAVTCCGRRGNRACAQSGPPPLTRVRSRCVQGVNDVHGLMGKSWKDPGKEDVFDAKMGGWISKKEGPSFFPSSPTRECSPCGR